MYIAQKMPSAHTFYKKDADVTQVNSMPKRIPHCACMLKEFDLIWLAIWKYKNCIINNVAERLPFYTSTFFFHKGELEFWEHPIFSNRLYQYMASK